MQFKKNLLKSPAIHLFSSLIALSTSSCVTVNVNFPESAVQKATDDYVKDLYRAKEKGKTPSSPPASSSSTAAPTSLLLRDFNLISSAVAADVDMNFKVDTSKANSIKERLASRVDEVIKYKAEGLLGETLDGNLIIKDPKALKPLLAKKLEQLVKDENKDRQELYDEIVSANNMNKTGQATVRKSFAGSFIRESPKGTWVQSQAGSWKQKKSRDE